ncbi:MAG: ribosomal protein S18-alanine N-acetyltransferase [Alphaproteobacteria bacterium]|jgi:ribosomal-protein-alanine acetyltransferase|nr:ribosomal protein S18-alanine N-acetyltransferase [Alphaproteobacteria bacterium]MBT5389531.1 ribosomal protein S18-alanine N-acetyltransferase [Alphaproteobacteria bacterium]MBT5540829.1 ribosomal protein S18-alanine N-acetyltransferase [Alphaproteobacteria bacterium]MBT5653888.1 ribosomal protein S18-alanine N-acetyltransferase [Alphaproteobacteria bacterium]
MSDPQNKYSKSIIYETATANDAAELSSLWKLYADAAWSSHTIEESLKISRYTAFKAIFDSDIVGFILFSSLYEDVEIQAIAVQKKYQNKGVGKALYHLLLKYIFDESKINPINIFLEVAKDNLVAQKFYKSLGFERIHQRSNYYSRQGSTIETAIIYKKIATYS